MGWSRDLPLECMRRGNATQRYPGIGLEASSAAASDDLAEKP
jgi:hypothetical protein